MECIETEMYNLLVSIDDLKNKAEEILGNMKSGTQSEYRVGYAIAALESAQGYLEEAVDSED